LPLAAAAFLAAAASRQLDPDSAINNRVDHLIGASWAKRGTQECDGERRTSPPCDMSA